MPKRKKRPLTIKGELQSRKRQKLIDAEKKRKKQDRANELRRERRSNPEYSKAEAARDLVSRKKRRLEKQRLAALSNDWPVDQKVQIKNEPMNLFDQLLESEEYLSQMIKQEPKGDDQLTAKTEIHNNPVTEIVTKIKAEPEEIQEFQFNIKLPKEVLFDIDRDNFNDNSSFGYADQSSGHQARSSNYTTSSQAHKRNINS